MLVLVCAAVVGAAAAVFAAGAGASPTWGQATQIAPVEGMPGVAQWLEPIAMNEAGDAVLEWEWFLDYANRDRAVEVMSRPRGTDVWTKPVVLQPDPGGYSDDGDGVGLDDAGDAVAILDHWDQQTYEPHSQAAVRPVDGAWGTPVTLSPAPYDEATQLAVNGSGDAVVVGCRDYADSPVAEAATGDAVTGVWQAATDISPQPVDQLCATAVAIDRAGDELALWSRPTADQQDVVAASFRPAGSSAWTTPVDVDVGGPYGSVTDIRVGFDAAGNAVAVWGGAGGVWSAERLFGGSWQPAEHLSPQYQPSDLGSDLALSVAGDGDALAVWTYGGAAYAFARLGSSGRWRDAPLPTTGEGTVTDIALAGDRAGNAVAVWAVDGAVPETIFRASLWPVSAGAWADPLDLGSWYSLAGDELLTVGLDGHGDALAAWMADDPSYISSFIVGDVLRPGGPVLLKQQIPARAAADEPVRFAITSAAWGAPLVGTPTWSFGDGTSGEGNQASHAYEKPGRYNVTVTQADTSGHDSTATGTIQIGAARFTNITRPWIIGVPRVGSTLTCRPGSWGGTLPIHFHYTWLRANTAAAAGSRYRLQAQDAGRLITCRVTATGRAPTVTVSSRPVRIAAR